MWSVRDRVLQCYPAGLTPARPTTDTRPMESSHSSGRRMTEALLREEGAPLNISAAHPTVVPIEGEEGGEICLYCKVSVQLQAWETRNVVSV